LDVLGDVHYYNSVYEPVIFDFMEDFYESEIFWYYEKLLFYSNFINFGIVFKLIVDCHRWYFEPVSSESVHCKLCLINFLNIAWNPQLEEKLFKMLEIPL